MLGVAFSIDEITMRVKCCHAKKRMMYKEKGDGLQTHDICQKGYKYKVFVCNDPFPKNDI